MMRYLLAGVVAVLVHGLPVAAAAQQPCPSNFSGFQSLTCMCGPGSISGTVWGSGPYTTDSSVCAAARHAGAIPRQGGMVTVQASPGCGAYAGSKNNGVRTSSYGPWSSSFYFPSVGTPRCAGVAQAPAAPGGVPACPASFQGIGGSLTCACSPASFHGQVWGSSTYTVDSSICGAALHAGAVSRSGGVVTVQAAGGCNYYPGTRRNGVASADYGPWNSSFYFPRVGGGGCAAPTPAPGPIPGLGGGWPRPPGR